MLLVRTENQIERKKTEDKLHTLVQRLEDEEGRGKLANLLHRLSDQSSYDLLTGLPGRGLMLDHLHQALASARRHHSMVGLVALGLDRFNLINDTLGHVTGDRILKLIAERLANCTRGEDKLGRYGGDDFIMLLCNSMAPEHLLKPLERFLQALSEPLQIDGQELTITGSIGVSLYPGDGENVEALLSNTEAAMYQAKIKGGNNFQLYSAKLNTQYRERLTLESQLHRALEREQFQLYYQPKMDFHTSCRRLDKAPTQLKRSPCVAHPNIPC